MTTFVLVFGFLSGCAFLAGVLIALSWTLVSQVRKWLRGD